MLYSSLTERSSLVVAWQCYQTQCLINIISVCNCHLFALSVYIFHVGWEAASSALHFRWAKMPFGYWELMKCTGGPRAQSLRWPRSHIWMKMRQACGKDFRAWRPPIRFCIRKRRDATECMNGKRGFCGRPEECGARNSPKRDGICNSFCQWLCVHFSMCVGWCWSVRAHNWMCVVCITVYIFITCVPASEVCICVIQCVWLGCGVGIVCVRDCSTICLSWFSVDAVQGTQLL